jgi:hypothetical protein
MALPTPARRILLELNPLYYPSNWYGQMSLSQASLCKVYFHWRCQLMTTRVPVDVRQMLYSTSNAVQYFKCCIHMCRTRLTI